jgi:hypothetical protein
MSEIVVDSNEPEYMLTTVDNPFDPFTQFDEWYATDTQMGYHTLAMLARVANVSDELSEPDQELAIQYAIEEIVEENVSGMWRKVSRSDVTKLPVYNT